MKKKLIVVFLAITVGGSSIYASSADATLTDIKESLYYLIKDYNSIKNKIKGNGNMLKEQQDLSSDLKKKIKNIEEQINKLNKKFVFEESKSTEDDAIIDSFVKNNR